jgi:hypothetical protein
MTKRSERERADIHRSSAQLIARAVNTESMLALYDESRLISRWLVDAIVTRLKESDHILGKSKLHRWLDPPSE